MHQSGMCSTTRPNACDSRQAAIRNPLAAWVQIAFLSQPSVWKLWNKTALEVSRGKAPRFQWAAVRVPSRAESVEHESRVL